jgi:hypothetical protein
VRLPLREVTELLDHSQRLMAHLSVVRLTLARRGAELRRPDAEAALARGGAAPCARAWTRDTRTCRSTTRPTRTPSSGCRPHPPSQDFTPWLLRRLDVAVHDGRRIHRAARAALDRLR